MPISATDLAKLRGKMHYYVPHLNITPKVIIGTCQINQTTFPSPLGQLTVDNASFNGGVTLATVPVGSLVWIGTTPGACDVAVSSVRKNGSSTQLYINGIGSGDPGRAVSSVIPLADNQYITIIAIKPIWAQISRIALPTFELYKQYDIPYTDEGSKPDPVCNIGPWRRIAWQSGGVSATFTNAAVTDVKPASFTWGSATISSYQWWFRNASYELNTGGTFVGGDTGESATITFTAPGFYIVYCQITDSNSKSHTAETYVWIVDGDTVSDLDSWLPTRGPDCDLEGASMQFSVFRSVAETEIWPGAAVLYTEDATFDGETVSAGVLHNAYVGYIIGESSIRAADKERVIFDTEGPGRLLARIAAASQWMEEAANPANWTQVTSALSNPNGAAWYILHHHAPNYLKCFDFWKLTGWTMRDSVWKFTQDNIWAQLREIQSTLLNVGCDMTGALHIKRWPVLLTTSERAAIDTRMTWTAADIREDLTIEYDYNQRVGMVDAYAFAYDGTNNTPYWSRSPADVQGQGSGHRIYNYMVIDPANAQTTLNSIAGHLFARDNNPIRTLQIKVARNLDIADPAWLVWHKLTIDADLDPRGKGFNELRMFPTQVNRRWYKLAGSEALVKQIDIQFEAETSGVPGVAKDIPQDIGDGGDVDGGDWNPPDGYNPDVQEPYQLPAVLNQMALFADGGYVAITNDFTTHSSEGGPTWEVYDLGIDDVSHDGLLTVIDFVVDGFSYYQPDGEVDGWLAAQYSDGYVKIFRLDDLFGARTVTEQLGFYVDTFQNVVVLVDASFGIEGWAIVTFAADAGSSDYFYVKCYYTTDGGANWSGPEQICRVYSGSAWGLYVSSKTPGLAYVTGTSGSSWTEAKSTLYRTTNYGASWSATSTPSIYSNSTYPNYPPSFLYFPWANNPNELICYYDGGYFESAPLIEGSTYKTQADGVTIQDIGPQKYTTPMCASWNVLEGTPRWRFTVSPANSMHILYAARIENNYPHTGNDYVILKSSDGGNNWIELLGPVSSSDEWPRRVAIDGVTGNTIYLFGIVSTDESVPAIAVSYDFGETGDDKTGNLRDVTSELFFYHVLAICGGFS